MGSQKFKDVLRIRVTNLFGFLGYLACSLQWFWALIIYSSIFMMLANFVNSNNSNRVTESIIPIPSASVEPSPLVIIMGVVIMIMAIVLTVYSFAKIPSSISKSSKKVVAQTVEVAAPVIAKIQHKPDTKKFRFKVTPLIILTMKLLLITIPIILVFFSRLLSKQFVEFNISLYIGFGLLIFSVIFFALQYFLAAIFRIDKNRLW